MKNAHVSPAPLRRGWLARTAGSLKDWIRQLLGAKSLPLPELHSQWQSLTPVERIVEAVRYTALRFEWWISPGGVLRAYLRRCIQIALFIGIPALLLGPALVQFLGQAVSVAAQFAALAHQIVQLSRNLLLATAGFVLLGAFWRALIRRG